MGCRHEGALYSRNRQLMENPGLMERIVSTTMAALILHEVYG